MTQILQWIGWFLLQIYEFFANAHIPAAYALSLVVFTPECNCSTYAYDITRADC